jgi:glycosyltransferase involved in cell wall biosynthesis
MNMNLLYFNPVGSIGGAEMCLLDLLASTTRARPGWRLSVILGDDGPLRPAVEGLGVRCLVESMPEALAMLGDSGGGGLKLLARMAASSAPVLSHAARLRRLFRSERPDLVQTNGMKAHLLGSWAAPRGVPVVWHLHDYLGPRPAMARLLRLASRRPGLSAVAVSRSVLEDARRVLGPEVPIRAIHNAVDVRRFAPGPGDGPALDRASGLPDAPPGTIRVGLVATFARWKGHEVFFEAISRIAADRPARFYVVGGPIYRSSGSQWSMDELKLEAARRGLADRVGFVGPVDDPARALRSLDVAVHASTRPEPFGRAIVEGMATGLAVVAMTDGGAAELFDDGESALGCPPNDPGALALAIDRLILDPSLRRRLGEAGRRAVLARFDADRLFEIWAPVYLGASRSGEARPARPPISSRVPLGRAVDVDKEVSNAHGR